MSVVDLLEISETLRKNDGVKEQRKSNYRDSDTQRQSMPIILSGLGNLRG